MWKNESKIAGLFLALGVVGLPLVATAEIADVSSDIQQTINVADVRYQEIERRAEVLVVQANSLYEVGNYDAARELYILAKMEYQKFPNDFFRKQEAFCDRMIKETYIDKAHNAMRLADERVQVRDFEEAIRLLQEAQEYCPEEAARLQRLIDHYCRRLEAAEARAESSIERLVPNFESQEYQVQVLLQQGRELALRNENSLAQKKFQEALLIDPYNPEALQNLKAINYKIDRIGKLRFSNTTRKMLVEGLWKYAIIPDAASFSPETLLLNGPQVKVDKEESALQKKLNSIIIPRIDFEEVTVETAIKNLREQSRQHDPERIGVNIVLLRSGNAATQDTQEYDDYGPGFAPPPEQPGYVVDDAISEQTIELYITDRPLMDAIINLCHAANLRYQVDQYAVVLAPRSIALDDMETRIFPVEQSALSSIDGGGEDRLGLRTFFEEKGVEFPDGSRIVYDTRISRLIVTNTEENLRNIEEIINEVLDQQEPMVQIMAKFIEISQTKLDELAFNYQYSVNSLGNRYTGSSVVIPNSSNEIMRYYREDAGSSGNTGSVEGNQRNPIAEGTFSYIWENSDGTRITASMFALDWADSADVLASPRVTTLPSQTAHIEMVTERYFPDDWETITRNQNNAGSGSDNSRTTSSWYATRADPQPVFESEPTKLGISFDITPEVDRDRRTITAQIVFPIQTFSGWMIFDSRQDLDDDNNNNNDDNEYFQMPIFDKREINTMITVYDGDTVVLGGVASDTTTILKDKIPVLGDIPLIGRFFQSRYTDSEKRHLLVFLTCKLVKPDGSAFYPAEERNRGVPNFGRNQL